MARRDGSSAAAAALQRLWLVVGLIFTAWPLFSEGQSSTTTCPLNFTLLNPYPSVFDGVKSSNNPELQCTSLGEGLEAVTAAYLRETGFFLVPKGSSSACVDAYQSQVESRGITGFNISSACASDAFFAERGTDLCHNIQTAQDFANLVPAAQLSDLNSSCSQSLKGTACGNCQLALVPVTSTLNQIPGSNNASCTDFVNVYTTGIVNSLGPDDPATILCILYLTSSAGNGKNKNLKYIGVGVGGMLFLCIVGALVFFFRHRHKIAAARAARNKRAKTMLTNSSVASDSINWFSIDDLRRATGNFSRANMLGTGGFGNVYKGTLSDGTVVAVKRFKNSSPAGDADFVHEVQMISSVRHTHLVAIKGCCVDSSGLEGHQRIIVYDYMQNGSLQDHLFGRPDKPGRVQLDWPARRKIAIGTAKGLAYLHHDALPAIFHRDIKAGNILLDSNFNALLGDFGLAKFTPEGVSHLTTRAMGTYGYIAPEYAQYGQLTAKSDVYSFGMVVLELLTGKKALSSATDDPPHALLSDWAWPLMKQGRWKSMVDPSLGDSVGSDEEMERFFTVAFLCASPQMHVRPPTSEALKMLEGVYAPPTVPDRPLPLTANRAEIEEALSRESREKQEDSNRTGYSSYSMGSAATSLLNTAAPHSDSSG